MIAAVIHVVGETRSFERAELTLRHVLGHAPSPKTIERLAHQVGGELAALHETQVAEKEVSSPQWPSCRVMAAASEPVPRMLVPASMTQLGARPRTHRLNE